jgi:hypothetical protein
MTPVGPLRLEYGRPVELRTIPFAATITQYPDGATCDPDTDPDRCIRGFGTTKETGRIFLSIGYPF